MDYFSIIILFIFWGDVSSLFVVLPASVSLIVLCTGCGVELIILNRSVLSQISFFMDFKAGFLIELRRSVVEYCPVGTYLCSVPNGQA